MFEVTQELASMNSLCEISTGKYMFKEIEKTLIQYKLKWNLLRCVTTDVGKNICGIEKALVGQIYKACENVRYLKPIIINCIIHQ